MKSKKKKRTKNRLLNAWSTSLANITLILILVGLLSIILINARQLSEYVREQIGFTLVLKDSLKEVEIIRLQKILQSSDYVKSVRYIDKETAARELSAELGEDFKGFLGYNPLFASLDVKIFANYTSSDSLQHLEKLFSEYAQVDKVYYQKNLAGLINNNINKISGLLLLISGLLTFIFFGLINNTIRLLIYSQRFIINTMQMVGASKSYIRRPFLKRSAALGATGAILANIVLIGGMYTYQQELSEILTANDFQTTIFVAFIVFAMGFLISLLSTWLALNKFLRLKFDELFY